MKIVKLVMSIILLLILSLPLSLFSAEPIEGIIAVVGGDPIMISELAAQMQMVAIQQGIKPQSQEEVDRFQQDILNQMISERLFLAEARKDTSIRVSADEIEQTLEEHIAKTASQFPSEDQFLQQLAAEGLTLHTFKKQLRPEIENQLMKQRLVGSKLASVSVSRQEVFDFYENFKDSIPIQPEAIRLAHILITFQPSGATEDSVLKLAEKVRTNVVAGADFATVAATHSSGPSALNGGDLGFVSRGDVVDEFGRVAFNLSPGDVSGAVRTQFGYHIIKCEEIKGKKAHLRHILFDVSPTAFDSALSYQLVDSLVNEINQGTDFKELAKIFSADDDSRRQGGELGWFSITDLPAGFATVLDKLTENDAVYGPALSEYGLHILKRLDRTEEKSLNPESDFDQIREMARQMKSSEMVDKWLAEIKERTYYEIRPIKK